MTGNGYDLTAFGNTLASYKRITFNSDNGGGSYAIADPLRRTTPYSVTFKVTLDRDVFPAHNGKRDIYSEIGRQGLRFQFSSNTWTVTQAYWYQLIVAEETETPIAVSIPKGESVSIAMVFSIMEHTNPYWMWMDLYANGVLQGGAISYYLAINPGSSMKLWHSDAWHSGSMSDVAIWDKALSAAEVTAIAATSVREQCQ